MQLPSDLSLHPDVALLGFLLGSWRGEGAGDYPTVDAFRYAEEMTRSVQVDPTLVEALRRDLGEAGLVQLTLSIAAANFTTRFNEALATDLEMRTATPAAQP